MRLSSPGVETRGRKERPCSEGSRWWSQRRATQCRWPELWRGRLERQYACGRQATSIGKYDHKALEHGAGVVHTFREGNHEGFL
jgi:hypothetical protein